MPKLLAITQRDLMALFNRRRGMLIVAGAFAVWAFYFFNILGRYNLLMTRAVGMQISTELAVPTLQQFVIEPYLQLVLASLAIIAPLLSMSAFAEEKQTGTFELLRTSPLSIFEIVGGKFFALALQIVAITILAVFLPYCLLFYGAPDAGLILSGSIGLLVCGISFASIALACSAICQQQLSAAVSGVFTIATLLLLHTPAQLFQPDLRQPFELGSAYLQAATFFDGYISLGAVVYFALLTTLALLAAIAALDRSGQVGTDHNSQPSNFATVALITAFSGVTIYIFAETERGLALIVLAQLLIAALFGVMALRRSLRADLRGVVRRCGRVTLRLAIAIGILLLGVRSGLYLDISSLRQNTLSPHTETLLKNLPEKIKATYFLRGDFNIDDTAQQLLARLSSASGGQLLVSIVDPVQVPDLARQYGVQYGDILKLEIINDSGGSRSVKLRELSETQLSAALVSLTAKPQRVYFLSAPGAVQLRDSGRTGASKLATQLMAEGIEVAEFSDSEIIPTDAAAVIVLGPKTELSDGLITALDGYLEQGGRLLITLDPLYVAQFRPILEKRSILALDGVVIDREQLALSSGRAGLQPLVRQLADHPITNRLGATRSTLMNIATPLGVRPNMGETNLPLAHELLWASPGSTVEADVLGVLNGRVALVSAGAGSKKRFALGAAAVNGSGSPAIVVFGDTDWIINNAIDYYSNRDLALNSVQWLLGNSWALNERSRTELSATVAISAADITRLKVIAIIFIELLLIAGVVRSAVRNLPQTGPR